MNEQKSKCGWLICIVIIILIIIMYFFRFHSHVFCKSYKFVNKDFSCGVSHVIDKASYVVLEKDLRQLINDRYKTGEVKNVSVYFRDLRGGPIMGINENAFFAPASLLKLPLVITLFSLDEESHGLLQKKVAYSNTILDTYGSPRQLEVSETDLKEGGVYTLEYLAEHVLRYSDNSSYYALVDYLNNHVPEGTRKILNTWQEIGVIDPRSPEEETVSVRGYSTLYRVLYNASYLSVENSEKILDWLSEAEYSKGLRSGVPQDLDVAHKFGERLSLQGLKQLHDCGIVYFPENPYLLCVMTQGQDTDELSEVIETISTMIYTEVDKRKK